MKEHVLIKYRQNYKAIECVYTSAEVVTAALNIFTSLVETCCDFGLFSVVSLI